MERENDRYQSQVYSELQARKLQEKDQLIETLVFQIDEHPYQRKKGQLINLLTHLQIKNSIFKKI